MLAYLVAMAAMLFTAGSYGKMSGAFPSAGSTHTYAQKALNPHIGFLAGWAILVNLSVIRHFYVRRKERRGFAFFTNLIFPLAGAMVCSYVWLNLSAKAQLAGFAWLACGVVYIAILTHGFRLAPVSLGGLAAGDMQ